VDLAEVVAESIEKAPMPEHSLVVEREGPAFVLGDRAYLVRVVTNLLENARKYAPPATEVVIRVRQGSIEVADRGPGVEPGELEHIFEPFYRGARARSQSKQSGLGLGLMLARRVVTLLGGTIHAVNREGGGLAIRFELPSA
jgi:signal transduction histidine kinase